MRFWVETIIIEMPQLMLAAFTKSLRQLSFTNSGLGDVRLQILVCSYSLSLQKLQHQHLPLGMSSGSQ